LVSDTRIAHWLGKFSVFKQLVDWFDHLVGDLRDDINDSWGSDANRPEADRGWTFCSRYKIQLTATDRLTS